MNSAKVAGGSPEPAHLRLVPQLPVSHEPLPELSKLQPLRPHIRPDHPTGAVNTIDWPDFRGKPPPPKLSPGVIPGQTISLHWLTIVKILAPSLCFSKITAIVIIDIS